MRNHVRSLGIFAVLAIALTATSPEARGKSQDTPPIQKLAAAAIQHLAVAQQALRVARTAIEAKNAPVVIQALQTAAAHLSVAREAIATLARISPPGNPVVANLTQTFTQLRTLLEALVGAISGGRGEP